MKHKNLNDLGYKEVHFNSNNEVESITLFKKLSFGVLFTVIFAVAILISILYFKLEFLVIPLGLLALYFASRTVKHMLEFSRLLVDSTFDCIYEENHIRLENKTSTCTMYINDLEVDSYKGIMATKFRLRGSNEDYSFLIIVTAYTTLKARLFVKSNRFETS